MKKLEINNEVVSLRQSVRQARICVINKLIREAKRLRTSHGNEKQLERHKNKADKLLREVFALKRIKDDEISKFSIVSFENLSSMLQDPCIADETRAMAKIARYKSLSLRIAEFREKYPDYKKYISWRKKQLSTKKKRGKAAIGREELSNELHYRINNTTQSMQQENKGNAHGFISTARMSYNGNRERAEKCDKLEEMATNEPPDKESEDTGNGEKVRDLDERSENSRASEAVTKIISCQATVKRFTEILQETEVKERNERCDGERSTNSRLESTINDDFFVRTADTISCSSIAPLPKETNVSVASNVNDNAFTSPRIRGNTGKSDKPYGISKEKRNFEKRDIDDRDVYRGYGCKKVSGARHRKENKKYARDEEKRVDDGSAKVIKDERLHPSWAAKKKQQDIIKQGFQGKKIKFDED